MRMCCSGLIAATLLIGGLARGAFGDVTPMDEAVPEEKATSITCEIPNMTASLGGVNLKIPAGEYHYQVWLPAGYHDSGKRTYPCLFITMAGGNATPGVFPEQLAKDQMIAVCLTEAKNGAWEPIFGNFYAAYDDAVKRFRIAPQFKFMTGFSGGARAASLCTGMRPGFAGLFLEGAGFAMGPGMYDLRSIQANPGICVVGVFGISDFNNDEPASLSAVIPNTPHYFTMQEGAHHGANKDAAMEAMDYMDEYVYVHRPLMNKEAMEQYAIRFGILMARAKAADGMDKLQAYEAANRLAAARRLGSDKALAADVAEAAKQVKALTASPDLAKEIEARAAYEKVRHVEDSAWVPMRGQAAKLSDLAKQAATAYDAVAKKFDGTVYGKKAADRAEWLAKGADKPVKGAPKEKD